MASEITKIGSAGTHIRLSIERPIFVVMTPTVKQGIVVKSTGSWYTVEDDSGVLTECRIKGKFRIQDIKTTNPVAVGDRVTFELAEDGNGVINHLEDRTNYIIRRSVKLSKQSHILAANIDQSILVVTIKEPYTQHGFVDRYLAAAESFRIPVVLLFNKIDLYDDADKIQLDSWKEIYEGAGYKTLSISAITQEGIEQITQLLRDKVTLISGNSGVGKSTMINAVVPEFGLKTSDVSDYYKLGKHTTTNVEMHKLPFGGYIIDTPGIKSFGLYDLEKEHLGHYFPEMRAMLGECRFPNCLHVSEPNCAVKDAVESGAIAETRFRSYLDMLDTMEGETYRRT